MLVGSTTFLFGGGSPASLLIPFAICAGLVAIYRPWKDPSTTPGLDACLVAVAIAMTLQLVPMPARLIDTLSPSARAAWQQLHLTDIRGALPISVDLWSTAWAIWVYAMTLAVFLVARLVFAYGGVRIASRGIALVGLFLSAECLIQRATGMRMMYGRWKPAFDVAPPFGPFVNRNHFATWAILAIPICVGYLLAHGTAHGAHRESERWQRTVVRFMDGRSIWLVVSICLMLIALALCLSRAGWAGLAVGLIVGFGLMRRERLSFGWALAATCAVAAAGAVLAAPLDLVQRMTSVGTAATGRLDIWRATLPVVGDFWVTGTGAGTFETVMLVYQRVPSLFRINAAHNHYLQIAAEGGLLVGIPAGLSLVLFARRAWDALRDDNSTMYLLRLGAFSGLVAAATQSIWETGLTTPANAFLAALSAAIVLHQPVPSGLAR